MSRNSNVEGIRSCSYNKSNKKNDIPDSYYAVNNQIFKDKQPQTDLEKTKQLCIWLQNHIKGGPGLSAPSAKALQLMLAGKGGVCSDMVQVFNNFCVINDIPVREWGTTSAPFDRAYGGHSFNEVYCKELEKWVLVDPSWSLLFFNGSEIPLSVVEMYQLLRADVSAVHYETFNPKRALAVKNVFRNYLNPNITPFLICGYRNKTYDTFLKYTQPYLPVFVTHFTIYLLNKSYHYRFPLDDYKKIFA